MRMPAGVPAGMPAEKKVGAVGATLFERILDPANLAAAWEAVAENQGIPGVDELSLRRFRRNWEERLVALADEVRGNRYRPSRLRVLAIPKTSGGQRRIGVPTVTDRVLQRATLQTLEPRLDRKFLSCSYGYRPKRGVAQAVAAVIRYRDRGLRYVLEADTDDCFGSLSHAILRNLLAREIGDERVLALMRAWLAVTLPRGREDDAEACGIPLGMPISPLWANLYLHEMDWQLVRNRWPLVRYADDFIILTESPAAAHKALTVVEQTLASLALRLEPDKTGVTSFEEGFEFLGVRFHHDEYTFLWQQKRITVAGPFNWLWGQHMTYEY
jgi:group II intron reverse transcriptase/maturase